MKCSMVRKQQLESYFEDVLEIGGCVSDLNFGFIQGTLYTIHLIKSKITDTKNVC